MCVCVCVLAGGDALCRHVLLLQLLLVLVLFLCLFLLLFLLVPSSSDIILYSYFFF